MSRRRSAWRDLGWALVVSLFVNHGLVLPSVFYLAARSQLPANAAIPPGAPTRFEVEVAPVPLPQPKQPEPRKRHKDKRLAVELPTPAPELQPPTPVPPPVPPPEQEKQEKKVELVTLPPHQRPKMVELNTPESDRPPENARFLSDKNRQVEKETRAKHTNLERDDPDPQPASRKDQRPSDTPGAEKPEIADTREQAGEKRKASPPVQQGKRQVSPLLAMRPEQKARDAREEVKGSSRVSPDGELPLAQRGQQAQREIRGRRGGPHGRGFELGLDHQSLDRIDGEQAGKARELARLSPSVPKGGHHKKWERVRSALENFVPEVQPGNQTALGTRADPFAVYIARMHRNIHRFWGYGFLVDLDSKPDSNPMNKMSLWTMIEIVVLPSGEVEKATVVRPSGLLTFDVAALDTVFSAGPYEATPRAIRSADGRVYLHWRFHRDERQCGTFGVDPFILTTPPRGHIDGPMDEVAKQSGSPATSAPRELRRLHRRADPTAGGSRAIYGGNLGREPNPAPSPAGKAPARAPAAPPTSRLDPRDPRAGAAVRRFAAAFAAGSAAGMAAACSVPFSTQGRTVAGTRGELQRMLQDLLREAGGRQVSSPRILSVMQARAATGGLPRGVSGGDEVLLARVTLGGIPVTLLLRPRGKEWAITGLER